MTEQDWKRREYWFHGPDLGKHERARQATPQTTGNPILDLFKEFFDFSLPNDGRRSTFNAPANEIAWAFVKDFEKGQLKLDLERRLQRDLTDEETEEIDRLGFLISQSMVEGKDPAQAVSDALNDLGYLGPLGDHSSDDADAQPAWTAGGDADAEPYPASD